MSSDESADVGDYITDRLRAESASITQAQCDVIVRDLLGADDSLAGNQAGLSPLSTAARFSASSRRKTWRHDALTQLIEKPTGHAVHERDPVGFARVEIITRRMHIAIIWVLVLRSSAAPPI
ncbi:hypothetical protein ACIQ1J_31175 [Streptomyces sp. NPDC097107]|uniref:hypothetical protein n=1 Tax=Streptomyces sp. NPDC097107 TaxID=3366089 RepID=UPI00380B64E6